MRKQRRAAVPTLMVAAGALLWAVSKEGIANKTDTPAEPPSSATFNWDDADRDAGIRAPAAPERAEARDSAPGARFNWVDADMDAGSHAGPTTSSADVRAEQPPM